MYIAVYVCDPMIVRTDEQNEQLQMHAIRQMYREAENSNEIYWYCDLGESGASPSRGEYRRPREHADYLTFALLPKDDAALDEDYQRITDI